MGDSHVPFPSEGILPKRPSEALTFVEQNPKFDGRNVVVAILDTGVDPGAVGLQVTSDGKKKMVGLLDTSGGGDVDTSKVIKKHQEADGWLEITGLTDRTLKLAKSWDNPSGEWHVGVKSMFELFPSGLVSRLKKERKKKFVQEHAKYLVEAREKLDAFDTENKVDKSAKKPLLDRVLLLQRNELKNRLDILENQQKSYEDGGALVDCVVFQGGDGLWRAVIDTKGDGDMTGQRPLRSFAVYNDDLNDFEFNKWDDVTQLNYAVNIYENGNLLSVVVDSGAHGTHVASIVAGYHAGSPDLNGVAPGAQIISMKIGDGRLDGMETGASMIRAFNACAHLGVDIINMSFGEPSKMPDGGRVAELARELVEKHGVVFVSSAGNAGPALSTVGAPGATSDALIGVGAWVEPQLMLAGYALPTDKTPAANSFTWSSRGPAYDGHLGVTITAPGGAIAAVPEWCLTQKRLMNGTSMSSPNAAGGIALVLSGLKQLSIPYSPWTIKRAVSTSAAWLSNVEAHAQGHGLIQVAKAFEVCKLKSPGIHFDIPYKITVSGECRTNAGPARGIYIREPYDCQGPRREFIIQVEPQFPESDDQHNRRVKFSEADWNKLEARLHVRCTQPWVQAPSFLMMNAVAKGFRVGVDVGSLPNSSNGDKNVHFARIEAYDPQAPAELGPVFSIPVTVVKPEFCGGLDTSIDIKQVQPAASVARLRYEPIKKYLNVPFSPGHIVRHFIVVPQGATWMDISLSPNCENYSYDAPGNVPYGSSRIFYVHCLQMRQQSNYRDDELSTAVQLRQEPGSIGTRTMAVDQGGTVEVCIAQFWSSLGNGPVDIHVRFNGVTPIPNELTLSSSTADVAQVNVRADLGTIRIQPSGKLKTWHKTIRPTASKTIIYSMPVGPRDSILGANPPSKRPTYALLLVYNFKQIDSGKLTPRFPVLDTLLYESPFDSQMCMLFDGNKKLLSYRDAWPKPVTIPKGDITARVLVRHEDISVLEKIRDTPMVIERSLDGDIALTIHKTSAGAFTGSSSFSPTILDKDEVCTMFVACPSYKDISKKLPKGVEPGDVLTGTITYGKRNARDKAFAGTDKHPKGYMIRYVVPPAPGSQGDEPGLKEEEKPTAAAAAGDDENKAKSKAQNESPEKLNYKVVMLPRIKACIKTLEDIKTKSDEVHVNIFNDQVDHMETMIKQTRQSLLATRDSADIDTFLEELKDFEFNLASIKLKAAVAQNKDALQPKIVEGEKEQDDEEGKKKREKTETLCDHLIELLQPNDLLLALDKLKQNVDVDGVGQTDKQKELLKKLGDRRQTLMEALVFKLYANKFVPGMKTEDTEALLQRVAESKDSAIVQLSMFKHITFGRYATALDILDKKLLDNNGLDSLPFSTSTKELHQLRIQLLGALGWNHLQQEAQGALLLAFPNSYPPF